MMQNLSLIISAIATLGMLIVSTFNFCLLKRINDEKKISENKQDIKDQEFREQLSDLYKAIVISNLLSGNSDISITQNAFKSQYKGKTQIL